LVVTLSLPLLDGPCSPSNLASIDPRPPLFSTTASPFAFGSRTVSWKSDRAGTGLVLVANRRKSAENYRHLVNWRRFLTLDR
jgi:hypothetical protein